MNVVDKSTESQNSQETAIVQFTRSANGSNHEGTPCIYISTYSLRSCPVDPNPDWRYPSVAGKGLGSISGIQGFNGLPKFLRRVWLIGIQTKSLWHERV